ncbi:acidic mammalian chitinase-like [Asbolus verrucosus]|uniref:Acidic mammalian chitinase-like n=1 Tax=Asbolus verrucosus TaxID=1661398 RepID=A0A482VDS3_ASBVE|nr:acidic mammalian chitinase-like [Asbolus verrucosus]
MQLNLLSVYIFCVAYISVEPTAAATDKILCYYETWVANSFVPDDIDVNICTHVNYAFLGINEDGSLRLDGDDSILKSLGDLKSKNPNIKLILSVGGWAEGSTTFSHVAADADKKAKMAESTLWYLQTYSFDGVDIDWEYPGKRGGTTADKENFIDMLWVLRNKFNENGGYLLTTAVCANPECGDYNVNAISKVVDYVNVMTYDMHSAADGKTGQNSPLYPSSTDTEWERTHANCDAAINNWLNSGTAPEKTILGLGFYGHSYTLADSNNHGVGAPTVGEGSVGGGYNNICALTDGWTEEWDDEQQVPYKYAGDQWIGYDNPKSIGLKVQYAKSRNLGGVMMWAVDHDDKDGSCGTKNALLQAIKDNL